MKTLKFFAFAVLFTSLTSCGGSTDETTSDNASGGIMDNLTKAQKELEEISQGKTVEPVNFRELQKGLPESVGGFERVDLSGQTSGSMGFTVSQADARYQKGRDAAIKISVFDAGGIAMATSALAAWTLITIDKEDSNGYEKTTKFMGYPAYEKYYKPSNQSELSLFISERLIFSAKSRNLDMDDLKEVVKEIGPKRFEKVI